MKEQVVLVDQADNIIGREEKLLAHLQGDLHRAFSIFVFNSSGELLIQQRSKKKYHTPGLWSNTCCSHPRPGEELGIAVHRRLQEEMGFNCELLKIFSCYYKLKLDNNLIEHEHDHVFIGFFDGEPGPDPTEVENWQWLSMERIMEKMSNSPHLFTPWFTLIIHDYGSQIFNALSGPVTGKINGNKR
ncbi:MAG: isopentenyl-diphosphate Delta-isomerase [Thermodesulfobacteriota bacterium]|nr:isopentenyl-diphosphate Delta-isomerase [Thermodesulfobacteriota bacterium]